MTFNAFNGQKHSDEILRKSIAPLPFVCPGIGSDQINTVDGASCVNQSDSGVVSFFDCSALAGMVPAVLPPPLGVAKLRQKSGTKNAPLRGAVFGDPVKVPFP